MARSSLLLGVAACAVLVATALPRPASAVLRTAYNLMDMHDTVVQCQDRVQKAFTENGFNDISGTHGDPKNDGVFAAYGGYKGVAVCDHEHGVLTLIVVGPSADTSSSLVQKVMQALRTQ